MAEVVTLSEPRDTGKLTQTSYGNTATEEAANSPENDHIDKFPTSTTRGKKNREKLTIGRRGVKPAAGV